MLIYTGIVYQRAKQRMTTKAFHITRRRSFSVQCPAASTNAIAESTNKPKRSKGAILLVEVGYTQKEQKKRR